MPDITYTLRWTPVDAPVEGASGEVVREFTHGGSAISWARRMIKRGEMLMDAAELSVTCWGDTHAYDVLPEGLVRWSQFNARGGEPITSRAKTLKRLPRANVWFHDE